jgi:hypothetical protein
MTTRKYDSEILQRQHSTINAMIKGVLIKYPTPSWGETDEEFKREIFNDITDPNMCYYCNEAEAQDQDHFIPTNGRSFNPPSFGLEHDGNKIPSCKQCNWNKGSKHPIAWLEKGRTATKNTKALIFPTKRVDAFNMFWELFDYKLIADNQLTGLLIDQIIPKVEKQTAHLVDFPNWVKL